jgi:hypothetical protein
MPEADIKTVASATNQLRSAPAPAPAQSADRDVFKPIGFDAFGIHSGNYAIKVGSTWAS